MLPRLKSMTNVINLVSDDEEDRPPAKVRRVQEKKEEEDDDEDCMVVDKPAPALRPAQPAGAEDDDEDCTITGQAGQDTLRDLPHNRFDCGECKFSVNPSPANALCCKNCKHEAVECSCSVFTKTPLPYSASYQRTPLSSPVTSRVPLQAIATCVTKRPHAASGEWALPPCTTAMPKSPSFGTGCGHSGGREVAPARLQDHLCLVTSLPSLAPTSGCYTTGSSCASSSCTGSSNSSTCRLDLPPGHFLLWSVPRLILSGRLVVVWVCSVGGGGGGGPKQEPAGAAAAARPRPCKMSRIPDPALEDGIVSLGTFNLLVKVCVCVPACCVVLRRLPAEVGLMWS